MTESASSWGTRECKAGVKTTVAAAADPWLNEPVTQAAVSI